MLWRGDKILTVLHRECLRTALSVTHRCEHVCHPHQGLPSQGIRIFSVFLLPCPHLRLALEFQRGGHGQGPGCGVVEVTFGHGGVSLPELLQELLEPTRIIPRIPACSLSYC